MRKAQELSLNLIVVGALALLVLLIVGGVLIFGGGDLIAGIGQIGPGDEEVDITAFQSSCQSKCNTLNLLYDENDLERYELTAMTNLDSKYNSIKNFCCESADLDGNGAIEDNGDLGPETCALAYSSCRIGNYGVNDICDSLLADSLISADDC